MAKPIVAEAMAPRFNPEDLSVLARALNNAMHELRVISESNRLNSFDDVMTRIPPEIRAYLVVNQSPVYWPDNDYDPTK